MTREGYTYVLYSHGTLEQKTITYIGFTLDIERRIRQHRSELAGGAKYTASRKDWKLLFYLKFSDEKFARKFEHLLKTQRVKQNKKNMPITRKFLCLLGVLSRKDVIHIKPKKTPQTSFYVRNLSIYIYLSDKEYLNVLRMATKNKENVKIYCL